MMRCSFFGARYILVGALAFNVVGCEDDEGTASESSLDAMSEDAMSEDAMSEDAGTSAATDAASSDVSVPDASVPDASVPDAEPGEDLLSGVYNVETVTCAGQTIPLMVSAKVTFDGTSYLENWTLAGSECEVTFAGTVESTSEDVTLRDVEVTCAEECTAIGFCDPTHCSSDQTYRYSRTGDELLLSFTQQGDEFSCGPCGEGVASTYLLAELP